MYSGLLIILIPLFFGYLIPLHNRIWLNKINNILNWLIYIILFFMGMGLSFLENLSENLQFVFYYALIFSIFTIGFNAIGLLLFNKYLPWQNKQTQSRLKLLLDSLQLCGVVALGFVIGLTHGPWLEQLSQSSEYVLIILLFLIGIQLRNSGVTLRQIVLNRQGILIALIVVSTALIGGGLAALFLGLPIKHGFAVSSGMGWYSLSGIMITKSLGPVLGSCAFFNDLLREILALVLIPSLIRNYATVALGISGATSMDFALPVLQRSGGISIIPAAIVHGFILSLLVPIPIALFTT